MNLNKEQQDLNNRLDKYQRKLDAAKARHDEAITAQFQREIADIKSKLEKLKGQKTKVLGDKGSKIKALPFNRVLTKQEQADMGKLKKAVRGLVVVHPMTAIGRELGVSEVTGYAPKSF